MPGLRGGFSSGHGSTPPPKKPRVRALLVVAIVVVLLAIGGVGTYLAFFKQPAAPPPAPAPAPTTQAPSPAPEPPPPPAEQALANASARDNRRYLDVRTVQGGLELYFATNRRYPIAPLPLALGLEVSKTLSDAGFSAQPQGATYLVEVPVNPAPGGADYLYESLDGTTYSLTFTLEEGTAGLAPGQHRAQPAGIDGVGALTPPPAALPQFQPPLPTVDTDGDGLTDAEEALLGTDPAQVDSDGDTYADGREVASGYDPAAGSGQLLSASTYLGTFTSTKFGYSARYPSAWLARAVDPEESEVILSGAEAEFIEVLVVDNPERLTAQAWYARQVPGLAVADVPTFAAGGLTYAQSFDGLNLYLASGPYLFTLSYNIGTRAQASYYQLFQAVAALFIPPPPNAPPAS